MTIFYDDGKEFGNSACKVLGFSPEHTMKVELMADPAQVLALKFTVAITNAQLAAILRDMVEEKEPVVVYSVDGPNTQGARGHVVEHVDAPGPKDEGAPVAVWVAFADVALGQSQYASARDEKKGLLLQEIMLTDEQQAKYLPRKEG